MDLTAEFIEKIIELKTPDTIEVNGRMFSTRSLTAVLEPVPNSITVGTLTGLVEYLQMNFDNIEPKPILHVVDQDTVNVLSAIFGPFEQRKCYLSAKNLNKCNFRFGQYHSLEDFIIALQSQFVPTETTAAILKLIGNVKDENVKNWSDDGITQAVTAKKGIATVESTPVPNPVVLAPYRTFLEIIQPESPFVFRMRSGSRDTPECSIHEADGGLWKLEAISKVREFLAQQLTDYVILA